MDQEHYRVRADPGLIGALVCMYSTSLTSTVLVAKVREAPHVAETDGESNTGEKKVDLATPFVALDGRTPIDFRSVAGFCF